LFIISLKTGLLVIFRHLKRFDYTLRYHIIITSRIAWSASCS